MTEQFPWRDKLRRAELAPMRQAGWDYRDYILRVLAEYRGPVHRSESIKRVGEFRILAGDKVPGTLEQTVQQAFERHCEDSDNFCGKAELNLFTWPFGKGDGRWGVNERVCKEYVRRKVWTVDDL